MSSMLPNLVVVPPGPPTFDVPVINKAPVLQTLAEVEVS
jgi:hypothetical protein